MTRDERALLLSLAGAMAEILEAGAAPLDTISDHGREIRTLIDRIQAKEMAGDPVSRPGRRRGLKRVTPLTARLRTVPGGDPAPA